MASKKSSSTGGRKKSRKRKKKRFDGRNLSWDHSKPLVLAKTWFGVRRKYPWKKWFDGSTWILRRGHGAWAADMKRENLRGTIYVTASRYGIAVHIKMPKDRPDELEVTALHNRLTPKKPKHYVWFIWDTPTERRVKKPDPLAVGSGSRLAVEPGSHPGGEPEIVAPGVS